MTNHESFEYTYSALEQDEIRRIREKYSPKDEREQKLQRLRALDASVGQKATAVSIILGVTGTLVLGIGMCCCLVWTELFLLGIPVGLAGIAGIILAYPVYRHTEKKERLRIAPEILRLTDELL